jgi:hypothetical protein
MRNATKKDMTFVRDKTTRFRDAVVNKITTADLKDQGGTAVVKMRWDLNKEAIRDHVFILQINGEKAYIDLEELLSYTRLI